MMALFCLRQSGACLLLRYGGIAAAPHYLKFGSATLPQAPAEPRKRATA
jgi:hypothetical protein